MKKPFVDTMWTDCLFEIIEKAKMGGCTTIDLKEVDELVVRKSMTIASQQADTADPKETGG